MAIAKAEVYCSLPVSYSPSVCKPVKNIIEPAHSISYKIACAHTEDSDQSEHLRCPPKTLWILDYSLSDLRRLWSDCADARTV